MPDWIEAAAKEIHDAQAAGVEMWPDAILESAKVVEILRRHAPSQPVQEERPRWTQDQIDDCKRKAKEYMENIGVYPEHPRPSPQPVDIEALQKLYDASTPGEWYFSESVGDALEELVVNQNDEDVPVLTGEFIGEQECQDNWDLIAAAHNAMPQLLAEVRESRQDIPLLMDTILSQDNKLAANGWTLAKE